MAEERVCKNCRFWKMLPDGHQEDGEEKIGRCHRYPPVVNVLSDETDVGLFFQSEGWGFPVTREEHWCGEYRPV